MSNKSSEEAIREFKVSNNTIELMYSGECFINENVQLIVNNHLNSLGINTSVISTKIYDFKSLVSDLDVGGNEQCEFTVSSLKTKVKKITNLIMQNCSKANNKDFFDESVYKLDGFFKIAIIEEKTVQDNDAPMIQDPNPIKIIYISRLFEHQSEMITNQIINSIFKLELFEEMIMNFSSIEDNIKNSIKSKNGIDRDFLLIAIDDTQII